jgi:hypothetical protein
MRARLTGKDFEIEALDSEIQPLTSEDDRDITVTATRKQRLVAYVSRIPLERVMNSAEKPHQDADSAVSSVRCWSPVFCILNPFLSKFITRSRY